MYVIINIHQLRKSFFSALILGVFYDDEYYSGRPRGVVNLSPLTRIHVHAAT